MNPDENVDLDKVDDEILEITGGIINTTAETVNAAREMAQKALALAAKHREIAERFEQIAELHGLAAYEIARLGAEAVAMEWGISEVEEEEDEDGGHAVNRS